MGVIQKHSNLGQPSLPHSPFAPPHPPCRPSFAPAMQAKHLTTFLKGNIPLAIGNTRMKEAGKLHVVVQNADFAITKGVQDVIPLFFFSKKINPLQLCFK